jgi:hypothetical protein
LFQAHLRDGHTTTEARNLVEREIVNMPALMREARAARRRRLAPAPEPAAAGRFRLVSAFSRDLGYGARLLMARPAFTAIAVLTLALGIGATMAMFALIQGVLLRPLPVQEQDQLVLSWREAPTAGSAFYPFGDVEIEAVARESQLLESAAGVTRNGVGRAVVSDGGTSSYANVGLITGGFFEVLGAQALLGRRFTLGDDREGGEPVAVISHGYWRRHFGGVPDVIGRRITVNEQPSVIVGVMPSDLD